MDFIKPRRKLSYKERIQEIGELLNKEGQVSIEDLFKKWMLTPHYIRNLLFYAKLKYPYAEWDEENGILYIPGRKKEIVKGEASHK
jgi:hypothetical protein